MDPSVHLIDVPAIPMLAISILVLYVGSKLNGKVKFLRENFIPPAVTGGLLFSLLFLLLRLGVKLGFQFDMSLRDGLLLVFFSTVGLSVQLDTLKQGGKTLPLLVFASAVFLSLQNAVGVGIATALGADPHYGLMAGSISFAGGHGTSIAWGAVFEEAGVANASGIGLAFATFGLVFGGVVGGPIARLLLRRYHVDRPSAEPASESVVEEAPEKTEPNTDREHPNAWLAQVLHSLMIISLCVTFGGIVNQFLSKGGIKLPGFLTAMFMGILLSNLTPALQRPHARQTIDRFGTVSLHIFLAMSMMTVELWTLGGALNFILLLLCAQVLLMTLFAMFVVFNLAGKDYDAVVIAAGFSGLGLGATPVAIANINAVTSNYGPSPKAMILIPLIGAFFIDLLNAGTIQLFISWLG